MNKEQIIREIQRTAKANGGAALGWRRFEEETGIRYYDWFGQFWTRWGDAVREAGFEANRMSEAYEDAFLLEALVLLTRRLGRVPTQGDILLAARNEHAFPSEKVFRRLGSKQKRAARVVAFCEANPGNDDVAALWRQVQIPEQPTDDEASDSAVDTVGYVYLLRHGSRREYKIGRTTNPVRREGEIGIQLPEKLQPVHYIKTDDPAGIETYWHSRFSGKRKEGEWFALTSQDVRAFKRWKRIY
ncbi:MAG: GIY-YIG nuclease family protein [Verrucomicrobia bacterium]|nr:GIY-YIG nuclease family protein [Verrucomicrobiota bacterium]